MLGNGSVGKPSHTAVKATVKQVTGSAGALCPLLLHSCSSGGAPHPVCWGLGYRLNCLLHWTEPVKARLRWRLAPSAEPRLCREGRKPPAGGSSAVTREPRVLPE